MISIVEKVSCCGCEACAQACPQSAIKMEADVEGFLYPRIDSSLCVDCGLCDKVCPIKNDTEKNGIINSYALQTTDEYVREISTAGGAFYVIAKQIIREGGIVWGAVIDECNIVRHISVEKIEDLPPLCMSKYVQSRIGNAYKSIKESLKTRKVLFVGTPCQCAGLVSYLRRKPDNLILIDFLCHGVPSPKVWSKYSTVMIKKYSANGFQFRNKKYGYDKTGFAFRTSDGELIHSSVSEDKEVQFMLKAFFAEICSRPSCHSCHFKGYERVTDITMGDLWHIGRYYPEMNDNKGTTFVAVHTEKGKQFLDSSEYFVTKMIPYREYSKDDGINLLCSMSANEKRENFFKDLDEKSLTDLYDTYLQKKENVVKEVLKKILSKLGVLHVAQRINYKRKEKQYKNRK